MKKTTTTLGVVTLAVMIIGFGATAYAFQDDQTTPGTNCDHDRHQAMEQAFANLNYHDWVALMEDKGRVTEIVTQDTFAQFAQARALYMEGDTEGARALKQEIGLGQGQQKRMTSDRKNKQLMQNVQQQKQQHSQANR